MRRHQVAVAIVIAVCVVTTLTAQRQATAREMADAARDVPLLADVLELKPGMTVGDVGAGMGAMSIVFAKHLGPSGRVLSTDIGANQLAALREAVSREHLSNMTVIEGASAATNLPDACCDAIFMRDVYHHIVDVNAFDRSLLAALKPGGRLAIIDFEPRKGSTVPEGVNPNRGGHGVTPAIVEQELRKAGLTFDKTIASWPPGSTDYFLVLFRKPWRPSNARSRAPATCRTKKILSTRGIVLTAFSRRLITAEPEAELLSSDRAPKNAPGSSAVAITL
jgi:predicted methyltransferase